MRVRMTQTARVAEICDNRERLSKESIAYLKVQALIWRDVAMIAAYDPIRGRKLARTYVTGFIPYFGTVDEFEKLHSKLLPEAQDAGFITGVFDSNRLKQRSSEETVRWKKKLAYALRILNMQERRR